MIMHFFNEGFKGIYLGKILEMFRGKEKTTDFSNSFYISHKRRIKTFLKWFINKYLKSINLSTNYWVSYIRFSN